MVFIFALLAFIACAADKSHQRALLEWGRNEKVVEAGIRGDHSDEDEYLGAVIFWGKLTGISIRGNASTFGLLPNKDTARDFAEVQEWCKRNCKDLYWDESSKSVRLAK
jgi:hypothetical protein